MSLPSLSIYFKVECMEIFNKCCKSLYQSIYEKFTVFMVFFFQLDIHGNPYGLLAAHPMAPLVSLHHLDQLNSLFPDHSQMHSLRKLISAYHLDPARIVQQSICYDHLRKWSISISWGYTIQIYTSLLITADLQMPLQTFQTWRSSSDGPFTFNTRPMNSDLCQQPTIFFLDQVRKVSTGSVTTYKRYVDKEEKTCKRADGEVQIIKVSALMLDPGYWKNVLLSLKFLIIKANVLEPTLLNSGYIVL